jgi:hypothetical protein
VVASARNVRPNSASTAAGTSVEVRRECDGHGSGSYEGEPDHRFCEYRYAAIFHSKLPPCVGALLMFNHMLLVTDWTSAVILLRKRLFRQKVNAGHRGWRGEV